MGNKMIFVIYLTSKEVFIYFLDGYIIFNPIKFRQLHPENWMFFSFYWFHLKDNEFLKLFSTFLLLKVESRLFFDLFTEYFFLLFRSDFEVNQIGFLKLPFECKEWKNWFEEDEIIAQTFSSKKTFIEKNYI